MPKVYAIILAGGTGERLGFPIPKQFVKVAGKTVIEHTIEAFERHRRVDEIVLVINPDFRVLMEEILIKRNYRKVKKLLNGGETRKESSAIGVNAIEDGEAIVLIHDAVRPFVNERIINDSIEAALKYGAVDVAIPSVDTIIKVDDSMFIEEISNRKYMMKGQTPQSFRVDLIKKAHRVSMDDREVTDDCGLVLKHGLSKIYVVRGEERNIKLTYPEDTFLIDRLFQLRTHVIPGVSLEELKGKVIVIFGASRGIGKSVLNLAKNKGARAYGFSRGSNVDVRDISAIEESLEGIQEREGKIDFVVNTAGILGTGKLEDRPIEEIYKEISINYIGSINVVKASVHYLKETKGSIALFTSSSYTRGRALYTVYSSTKAAIVNLIQGLAEELNESGIRINAINPQRTATPMRFKAFGKEPPETLLDPEKVADATLKTLLSEITGQVIDVRKNG